MDSGPLLALDDAGTLVHGQCRQVDAVGMGQDVPRLDAGPLGGTALDDLHHIDIAVLPLGDGDAHAHIGVVHLLEIAVIALRAHVVAPAVPQAHDHPGGGAVLGRSPVDLADEFLIHQRPQLVELGVVLPGHIGRGGKGHHTGQRGDKNIAHKFHQFFHDTPRILRLTPGYPIL